MSRRTAFDEQLGQRCQHVFVAELACDDQRQALAAGFVDDGKDAELAPVVGAFLDEVIGPDVPRSEGHTSELQSLMRISYAVFCLKKKNMNYYDSHSRPTQSTDI